MQALEAAKSGVQRLEKQGKKWQRPVDYYAEMVKSDEHMARVKSQLMHEQTQIAEAQERCDTLCKAPPSTLPLDPGSPVTEVLPQSVPSLTISWKVDRAGTCQRRLCSHLPKQSLNLLSTSTSAG